MNKIKLTQKAYDLIAKHDQRLQRREDQGYIASKNAERRGIDHNPFIGSVVAFISGDSFSECQKQYEGE